MSSEELKILFGSVIWLLSAIYFQFSKDEDLRIKLNGEIVTKWYKKLPYSILALPFIGLALLVIAGCFELAFEICFWVGSLLLAPIGKIFTEFILPIIL